MQAPYTIAVDRPRALVRATLRGMWDLDVVARYADELRAVAARHEADGTGEPLRMLIDLRQHGVQPREVAEAIQAELRREQAAAAARHAVLVSPSLLHKMQAQRLGSQLAAAFFADEEEAMRWLFAP